MNFDRDIVHIFNNVRFDFKEFEKGYFPINLDCNYIHSKKAIGAHIFLATYDPEYDMTWFKPLILWIPRSQIINRNFAAGWVFAYRAKEIFDEIMDKKFCQRVENLEIDPNNIFVIMCDYKIKMTTNC